MEGPQLDRKGRSQIALNNLGSDHGYFLSAYLYGNHVSMLVDSGANVSILNKETIERMPYSDRPVIYSVQTSLISVTGETTPFLGKTEVAIKIGRHTILHTFLIAEIRLFSAIYSSWLTDGKDNIAVP